LAAICFIVGSLPTQEEKVMVTGEAGSLTGPVAAPVLVLGLLLPEQATIALARANTAASRAPLKTL
jgi:hypothetical protein